jgi:hypothetical protein
MVGDYLSLLVGNVAFAAGAALHTGPLLIFMDLLERFKRRPG